MRDVGGGGGDAQADGAEGVVTISHASARTAKIRFRNEATPGSSEYEDGQETKRLLYEAINRYLEPFAATEEGRCVCGMRLGGLLGTFGWGLVHGEGVCGRCGHPARAYHKVTADDGDLVFEWEMVLPYHPDELVEAAS